MIHVIPGIIAKIIKPITKTPEAIEITETSGNLATTDPSVIPGITKTTEAITKITEAITKTIEAIGSRGITEPIAILRSIVTTAIATTEEIEVIIEILGEIGIEEIGILGIGEIGDPQIGGEIEAGVMIKNK